MINLKNWEIEKITKSQAEMAKWVNHAENSKNLEDSFATCCKLSTISYS